jgi:hypothetical protein
MSHKPEFDDIILTLALEFEAAGGARDLRFKHISASAPREPFAKFLLYMVHFLTEKHGYAPRERACALLRHACAVLRGERGRSQARPWRSSDGYVMLRVVASVPLLDKRPSETFLVPALPREEFDETWRDVPPGFDRLPVERFWRRRLAEGAVVIESSRG